MTRFFNLPGMRPQLAATAVAGISSALLLLLLARTLGPEQYGVFALATAIGSIVLVAQDGGYRTLLFRELTQATFPNSSPYELQQRATGWSVFSTVIGLLICLSAWFTLDWMLAGLLTLVVLANLGKVWNGYVSSIIRAKGHFEVEARLQIRRQILVFFCTALCVFIWPHVIAALLGAIASQILLHAIWEGRIQLSRPIFSMPALWLVSIDVLTVAYSRLDLLVLGTVWENQADVGIYAVLVRAVDLAAFAVTPLAAIFFRSIRANPGGISDMAIIRLCLKLAVPGLIGLGVALLFADDILVLFLGAAYRGGAQYLPAIALAIALLPANFLMGQILISRDAERDFVAILLGALATKCIAVAIIVPIWGPLGCALTIILTEVFLLLACLARLGKLASRNF